MTPFSQRYKTAGAFRRALEDRLKVMALQRGLALDRLRRRVSFDRFLARIFDAPTPRWLLKGGYALELRLGNIARATKDIDFLLPIMEQPTGEAIREMLQEQGRKDMGDWFSFLIGTPMSELNQAVYGGWRYPVEVRLDNRRFGSFHVDVGVGDAVVSEPEWQKGEEMLSFAGIPPVNVALLPRDQQFAEKIHAYSYPRETGISSRTKDLVDLILLIEHGLPDRRIVRKALDATFERRKTHSLPSQLDPPPEIWSAIYRALAEECGVFQKTMEEAFRMLEEYWNRLFV